MIQIDLEETITLILVIFLRLTRFIMFMGLQLKFPTSLKDEKSCSKQGNN